MRLAALTGDAAWREQADRLFDGVLAGAADSLLQHAELLNALDLRLHAPRSSSPAPTTSASPRRRSKLPYPQPDRAARAGRRRLPAAIRRRPKLRRERASAAFVCVGETCSLPVTDPDKIAEVVSAMRPARA